MTRIELVFDRTCPNVDGARQHLRVALAKAGLPARWVEWDRAAPDTPPHVRQWASPTVLVNGNDVTASEVARATLDGGGGCRLYVDATGRLIGVPGIEAIMAALAAQYGAEQST